VTANDPLTARAPLQSPEAMQPVAAVDDHASVDGCPCTSQLQSRDALHKSAEKLRV